jgi:nucleoside-diphosphate-sugar epimerase
MKALVTGVAGFVGSHLAATLLARGDQVLGIDAFTDYYPRPIKEGNLALLTGQSRFQFREGSLQTTDLGSALDGVTHVFHLAGQPGVRKSWGQDFTAYTSDNIEATQRLLEAAKGRPLERFVYASSSSVYGDEVAIPMREDARVNPVSPYGVTKLAAEHLCHLYAVNCGVPTVSLRYFTVYGPRQRPDMAFHRFLSAAYLGRPISLYGDGDQTRDFTFVADAVAATIAAGDRGRSGAVYNIGGGSRVSVNEVLALVERVTGRSLQVDREGAQQGDMRDTFADTSRAQAEIGFAPKVSLAEGLAAEAAWLASTLTVPKA